MYEIVTIGSALVDIFIHSAQFQATPVADKVMLCQLYGEKVELESFVLQTGGGAGNTAVGLGRLGFKTAVLAEMGRDTLARMVTEALELEEVDTSLMIRERKEQTGGSVIMVGGDGQRTVMVHRGAASQLDVHDLPREKLVGCKWWHVSSVAGQLPVLQTLFTLARLHRIPFSWNPGKSELQLLRTNQLQVAEITCTLLFLNQEEWSSIAEFQSELKNQIPQIIVTKGAEGGEVFVKKSSSIAYTAEKVVSKDDTGAGDAFASGYIAAYLRKRHPKEAAAWGVANAASVVQQIGAKPGLLTFAQLQTILEKHHD